MIMVHCSVSVIVYVYICTYLHIAPYIHVGLHRLYSYSIYLTLQHNISVYFYYSLILYTHTHTSYAHIDTGFYPKDTRMYILHITYNLIRLRAGTCLHHTRQRRHHTFTTLHRLSSRFFSVMPTIVTIFLSIKTECNFFFFEALLPKLLRHSCTNTRFGKCNYYLSMRLRGLPNDGLRCNKPIPRSYE
jgi:hypothetical protein